MHGGKCCRAQEGLWLQLRLHCHEINSAPAVASSLSLNAVDVNKQAVTNLPLHRALFITAAIQIWYKPRLFNSPAARGIHKSLLRRAWSKTSLMVIQFLLLAADTHYVTDKETSNVAKPTILFLQKQLNQIPKEATGSLQIMNLINTS